MLLTHFTPSSQDKNCEMVPPVGTFLVLAGKIQGSLPSGLGEESWGGVPRALGMDGPETWGQHVGGTTRNLVWLGTWAGRESWAGLGVGLG